MQWVRYLIDHTVAFPFAWVREQVWTHQRHKRRRLRLEERQKKRKTQKRKHSLQQAPTQADEAQNQAYQKNLYREDHEHHQDLACREEHRLEGENRRASCEEASQAAQPNQIQHYSTRGERRSNAQANTLEEESEGAKQGAGGEGNLDPPERLSETRIV